MEDAKERNEFTLVARSPCFGLPTACPNSLPVYIYLKFAHFPFQLAFNSSYPDSDQIPYVEAGTYVAYNNENGGVIESLKQDGVINLDAEIQSLPEFTSTKAMINSWLAEALTYELWVGTDGLSARQMYYSDLPWLIGKVLFQKQAYVVKNQLEITKDNAEQREKEIYKRAGEAYGALSTKLGEEKFLLENRQSSLDAFLLAHVLLVLQALPESSVLRSKLLEHINIVRYAEKLKMEFIEDGSLSSSPQLHSFASSSTSRKGGSSWSSKPKSKPKKETSEEEKVFKKRAKFFLGAQFVAVLLYISLMGGSSYDEVEMEEDEGYE